MKNRKKAYHFSHPFLATLQVDFERSQQFCPPKFRNSQTYIKTLLQSLQAKKNPMLA